jgi:hypothetical protein
LFPIGLDIALYFETKSRSVVVISAARAPRSARNSFALHPWMLRMSAGNDRDASSVELFAFEQNACNRAGRIPDQASLAERVVK